MYNKLDVNTDTFKKFSQFENYVEHGYLYDTKFLVIFTDSIIDSSIHEFSYLRSKTKIEIENSVQSHPNHSEKILTYSPN